VHRRREAMYKTIAHFAGMEWSVAERNGSKMGEAKKFLPGLKQIENTPPNKDF